MRDKAVASSPPSEAYVNRSSQSTTSKEAPNAIFDLIEQRAWENLLARLEKHPSDALALNGSGAKSNFPLHEACKAQPPVDVVKALLDANPNAVTARGRLGYLPIHFACSFGASQKVLHKLITANPACVRAREEQGQQLPLHMAAKAGASQEILMTIMTYHPEGIFVRDSSGMTPMDHAAALPSSRRDLVITVLHQGPLFCQVSKAAQQRMSQSESSRSRDSTAKLTQELDMMRKKSSQYSKELEVKSSLIKKLEQDNSTLNAIARKALEDAKTLENELKVKSELIEQAQKYRNECEAKSIVIAELEKNGSSQIERALAKEAEKLKEEAESLRQTITEQNAVIADLEAKYLAELETAVHSERRAIEDQNSLEVTATQATYIAKVQSLERQLEQYREELDRVKAENKELQMLGSLSTEISVHVTKLKEDNANLEEAAESQKVLVREMQSKLNNSTQVIEMKSAKISELEAVKESLQVDLVHRTTELEEVKARLAEAAKEFESKSMAVRQLEGESSESAVMTSRITALEALLSDKEAQCVDLSDTIEAKEAELNNEKKRVQFLFGNVVKLEQITKTLQDDLKQRDKHTEEILADLAKAKETIESKNVKITEIDAIIAEKESVNNRVIELEAEVENEKDRVKDLLEQIKKLEESRNNLVDDLSLKASYLQEFKESLVQAKVSIASKTKSFSEIESLLVEKEADCFDLRKLVEELQAEFEGKNEHVQSLEATVAQKDECIISVMEKLENEKLRVSSLIEKVQCLEESRSNLADGLQLKAAYLKEVEENLADARTSLALKTSRVGEIESLLAEKTAEHMDLRKQVDDLQALLEAKNDRVESLEATVTQKTEYIVEIEAQLAEKKEAFESATLKVGELEPQIVTKDAMRVKVVEKVVDLERELETARETLNETKSSLEKELAQRDEHIKEIEEKLADAIAALELKTAEVKQLEAALSENEASCIKIIKRCTDLEMERDAKATRIAVLLGDIVGLQKDKRSLKSALAEKESHVEALETQHAKEKYAMESLANEGTQGLEYMLEEKETHIAAIMAKHAEEKNAIESKATETARGLIAALARKDAHIETVKAEFAEEKNEIESRAAETKRSLESTLADKNSHIESTMANHDEKIKAMEVSEAEVRTLLEETRIECEGLRKQIEVLEEELESEKKRSASLVENVVNLGEAMAERGSYIEKIEKELEEAKGQLESKSAKVFEIEESLTIKDLLCSEANKRIKELENEQRKEKKCIAALAQNVFELERAKKVLERDLKHAQNELKYASPTGVKALESDLILAKDELNEKASRVDDLEAKCGDSSKQIEQLESTIKQKEADLERAEIKLLDLTQQISSKEDLIKELESSLARERSLCQGYTIQLDALKLEPENENQRATSLAENTVEKGFKPPKIKDLEALLDDKKVEIAKLAEKVGSLEAAKKSLEDELEERSAALQASRVTLDTATEHYVDTTQHICSLEATLSEKTTEIEVLRARSIIDVEGEPTAMTSRAMPTEQQANADTGAKVGEEEKMKPENDGAAIYEADDIKYEDVDNTQKKPSGVGSFFCGQGAWKCCIQAVALDEEEERDVLSSIPEEDPAELARECPEAESRLGVLSQDTYETRETAEDHWLLWKNEKKTKEETKANEKPVPAISVNV